MSGVSPADVSISPRSPGSVASSVTRGMKFFFADSLDVVDPSFDFTTERRSPDRVPPTARPLSARDLLRAAVLRRPGVQGDRRRNRADGERQVFARPAA